MESLKYYPSFVNKKAQNTCSYLLTFRIPTFSTDEFNQNQLLLFQNNIEKEVVHYNIHHLA